MKQARDHQPSPHSTQTWSTFVANHAPEMWACDFVQTYDLFFRTIFVFFIIELGSRRVVHFGVTRSPTDSWVAQQLREATPFDERPRFLIRDNDKKFGSQFDRTAAQIEVLRTPIQAPKANAICERFIGSVRRECLDHILIMNERHLRKQMKAYVFYFNRARPHQGTERIPESSASNEMPALGQEGRVVAIPVLSGLHHDYRRAG